MSHSSGYGVQVSAAELQRRRDVSESAARCAELQRRAAESAAAAVAAGAGYLEVPEAPTIDAAGTTAAAKAASSAYERRIKTVLAAISTARTDAVLAAFDREAPPGLSGTIAIAWKKTDSPLATKATAASTSVTTSTNASSAKPSPVDAYTSNSATTDRARAMLSSLAALDDPDRRNELFSAVAATIGAADASRRLDDLFSEMDSAFRAQAAVATIHQEADELVATLRQYDSVAANEARRALVSANTRDALRTAALLARTAREEAETREREDFVVEQAAAVLRELGYDVDDSFVETAERGEYAVATNRGLGNYGLQVRMVDHGQRILTNTVALDANTTHDADVAAEEHVCGDLAIIAEKLGRRGVRLDRFFESKPGELAIERRLDVAAPASGTLRMTASPAERRSNGLEAQA